MKHPSYAVTIPRIKAIYSSCSYISSINGHNKYSYFIKKYANVLIDEKILARIELLRKHSDAYRSILKHLNDLTNNMRSIH